MNLGQKLTWDKSLHLFFQLNKNFPDKLIKRDFTLPDRSGTGRGTGGGMLRSTLAR